MNDGSQQTDGLEAKTKGIGRKEEKVREECVSPSRPRATETIKNNRGTR